MQIGSCSLRSPCEGDLCPIFNHRTKLTLLCYRRSAAPKHRPPENFVVGQCFIRQLLLKCPSTVSSTLDRKCADGSGVDHRSDRNWAGHQCSPYDPANDRRDMQIITSGNQSLWVLVSNVPWVSTKSNFDNWRDWDCRDWTGYHVCDRTVAACRAFESSSV